MSQPAPGADHDRLYLFSPSACYPSPVACLIDRQARLVHAWSSTLDQPDPTTDPPAYLCGWNHVELGEDGSLYAMVPLQALLKLGPDSTLIWKAELPVHHDLDVSDTGQIHVLTEQPRVITSHAGVHVLLDNTVTVLRSDGQVRTAYSLYDILTAHPVLAQLIEGEIAQRRANAPCLSPDLLDRALAWPDGGREISRQLRALPGSPGDILHTNTIEVLASHPQGIWRQGDVLISLRDLNVVAVLDLAARAVRWWWGRDTLSGQHQPSALPGGTILVFDNGRTKGRSRVLEIDPLNDRVVWEYAADPPTGLFSALAGGCQHLPDDSILISDAQAGRAFEIARDGRTLWAVQVRTAQPTAVASRVEFYRMTAIPAAVSAVLDGGQTARHLAESRLLFDLFNPRLLADRSTS